MPRPLYKDPAAPVEARVKDLLSRMTLEEKAEQLCQDTIGKDPNPDNHGVDRDFDPRVGSVYQYLGDTRTRNAYQRAAVERTRLGIPILWALDVIHGWRTMFPVPLAQAASFRPDLTERAQRVAARECWQDGGIDWLLGPMVEVGHDPRWGRNVEGYGEDPYTSGRFAAAAVRGIQKDGRCTACVKHFVGYSACEGGRDYSYTEISARAMREWYLPPFAAAAKAGALTMMSSFNEYDGVPVPASRALLTDELRGRMGFKGFVVSDSGALHRMGNMGYASDPVDQTARAIHAGNEMSMGDGLFRNVPAAVAAGKLPMEEVDGAVARVLRVKFRLGLFENPYTPERPTEKTCRLPADIDLAHRFARETMVLLKNDPPRRPTGEHGKHGKGMPILPLDPKKIRTLALIGPAGDEVHPHLGNWRAAATDVSKGVNGETFLDAARRFFPKAEIRVARGCTFWDYTPPTERDAALRAEAVEAARGADVVLLCFGEVPWMCGEKKSRRDISLPPAQTPLIEAIAALGRPLVGLCCSGRALAFPDLAAKMDALLWCWQSGCRAPTAAMEILTGRVNPSGKLPISFPRSVGQIPVFYNHHGKITPDCPDYQDLPDENGPWFPFGFGLSYTTFRYGKVSVSRVPGSKFQVPGSKSGSENLRTCEPANLRTFDARVTVKNAGRRAGKETVIWYLTDPEASYTQPVRRVIAFEKIALRPGESRTVRLRIDPMRDLAYDLPDGRRVLEPGDFVLSASLRSEVRFRL